MKNEPTPARADGTIAHRPTQPEQATTSLPSEVKLRDPAHHEPGQSLVTRRAISQIVRAAVSSSYGVTGLADDDLFQRVLARLGIRRPGVLVRLSGGLQVELRILVAAGVPIAEVARQVDSAVRYSVRRATGREIGSVTIHVGGLRFEAAPMPRPMSAPASIDARDGSAAADPGVGPVPGSDAA